MTTARLHEILKLLRAELEVIEKTIDTLETTPGKKPKPRVKPKTTRASKKALR